MRMDAQASSSELKSPRVKKDAESGHQEYDKLKYFELALENIDFLIAIPEICVRLCEDDNEILKSQLGPALTDLILQLFLKRMNWMESKKGVKMELNGSVSPIVSGSDGYQSVRKQPESIAETCKDVTLHPNTSITKQDFERESLNLRKHASLEATAASPEISLKYSISGKGRDFLENETRSQLFPPDEVETDDHGDPTPTSAFFSSILTLNDLNKTYEIHLPRVLERQQIFIDANEQPVSANEYLAKVFQTSSENTDESFELDLSSVSDKSHLRDEIITLLKGDPLLIRYSNKISNSRSRSSEIEVESPSSDHDHRQTSLQTILETEHLDFEDSFSHSLLKNDCSQGSLSKEPNLDFVPSPDQNFVILKSITHKTDSKIPRDMDVIDKNEIRLLYAEIFYKFNRTNSARDFLASRGNILSQFSNIERTIVSNGLWKLRECLIQIIDLFRVRPHITNLIQKEHFSRRSNSKSWMQKQKESKNERTEMISVWNGRINESDIEVLSYAHKLEESRYLSLLGVTGILRRHLHLGLEQRKSYENEKKKVKHLEEMTREELEKVREYFFRKEKEWKLKIFTLENSLRKLIQSYDSTMTQKQGELDFLKLVIKENDKNTTKLENAFADTEERFEEMRITKKLKEILRNIEMADNFKRNRAARVIQAAYRRYRIKKFRKMRRKARLRRKPGIPGESRKKEKDRGSDCLSDTSSATTMSRVTTKSSYQPPKKLLNIKRT